MSIKVSGVRVDKATTYVNFGTDMKEVIHEQWDGHLDIEAKVKISGQDASVKSDLYIDSLPRKKQEELSQLLNQIEELLNK